MIRMTVRYDLGDQPFDMEYFTTRHAALVHRLCDPLGLKALQVDRDPAAGSVTAHLIYDGGMEIIEKLAPVGPELMGDRPNYTPVEPTVSLSEVIHSS